MKAYALALALLLGLTALTTVLAFVDLGPLNAVVAVAIATTKAVLVALVFMHLGRAGRLAKVVAVGGVYFVMVLVALTLADVLTRA